MPTPKKEIDEKIVRAMAFAGSPTTEIGEYLGIPESTIRRRCGEILTKVRARRHTRLRQLQWKAAKNGSTAMMIWLGKQELGQSDKIESKNEQVIVIKEKLLDTSPQIEDRFSSSSPVIGTN